ncbi:MAG TPA: response regulator transcription factor [Polyangiaceae bacterium]|jgi:DNA-binding response OmpR family regulator|nr:response regulator transcription factor [Polyangiaceae bacterium]
MRIVVAEDDPVYRQLLTTIIRRSTDHEVIEVEDGAQALEQVLSATPPDVLILDWIMPHLSGTEVCSRVRMAQLDNQPYVFIVTAKNRRDEIIEGLSVGADDLLCKPVAPDLLLARLRVAERRPTSGAQGVCRSVTQALIDARAEGHGELIVRDADLTARLFFHDGKVAWVQMSDDRSALLEVLAAEDGTFDEEAVSAAISECRSTGARLSDTLVNFGLVDRARLRDGMQLWIRRKLATVCRLANARTLFVPQRRHYAGDLLFDLTEVMDGAALAGLSASIPPPRSIRPLSERPWKAAFVQTDSVDPHASDLLERCMQGVGVRGAALLQRSTGSCSGVAGHDLNPDIAWAHIHSLSIVSRDERVVDSAITTNRHYHLVHLLPGSTDTFVYVVVDCERTRMTAARRRLKEAMAHYEGPALIMLGSAAS